MHHDIIVIGAGPQGLVAAKTFLQCNPSLHLCIIDAAHSIGGVWRKEALYPGLRTNNERGTYEFSDLPMTDELGVKKGEHIPGSVVHSYLCKYAEKHDLVRRCRLDTKVDSVVQNGNGWLMQCTSTQEPNEKFAITCEKLVVATGLTSAPAPIELRGMAMFERPIIDTASLPTHANSLLHDTSVKHVTVFGGGKSSYDAVYLFASHGKNVTWIMRRTGHGPTWMALARQWIGPVHLWMERVITARLVTLFSPCIWGSADGFGRLRELLHGTRVGRWLVGKLFDKIGNDILSQSGLLRDEKLKVLIPDEKAIWYGTGLSILNYPSDIHEFILSGQVQVLRHDIETLSASNKIHFSDPNLPPIETDALICGTGWNYALPFDLRPHELHASLGIPSIYHTTAQESAWSASDSQADIEIFSRLPMLRKEEPPTASVPAVMEKEVSKMTPWRLWRGIAPPGLASKPAEQRSIVFLGMVLNLVNMPRMEISALWAYAWMNGDIDPFTSLSLSTKPDPPMDPDALSYPADNVVSEISSKGKMASVIYDTSLFTRFCRWRHPYGFGARFPDFTFDGLPYFDLLLRDLGVRHWRKGSSMLGELFSTGYLPADYRGIVEEWKSKMDKI